MIPATTPHPRPVIVISAVNLIEGGTLSILSDCLHWVDRALTDRYEVVALVHRASMFDCKSIRFLEMPRAKRSWLLRIWHEYRLFKPLSLSLQPFLWLSLHDTTPNVVAQRRAVYCHNPSPFYQISLREAWHEPTLLLFNLFYKYLYRINIRHNDFVIVQQQWIKREFERLFALPRIIVAHPQIPETMYQIARKPGVRRDTQSRITRLIYPAFPRAFKNLEVLAEALLEYSRRGLSDLEVLVTVDGTENRYARWLYARYARVEGLRFIGRLSRAELFSRYDEVDAMVFPSKLETWGLPLTEFKALGKPILAADLPYAHETIGAYDRCAYFTANDHRALADLMGDLREGQLRYARPSTPPNDRYQVTGWEGLFGILLDRVDP